MKRLVASVNLITFSKAYSDEKITHIIGCLVRAYLNQIYEYCNSSKQRHVGITTENTEGPVNILLKESRLGSKEEHLDKMTVVENYERKFIRSKTMKDVDPQLRHQIALAFQDYLRTIPESKKDTPWPYKVTTFQFEISRNPFDFIRSKISFHELRQALDPPVEPRTVF